MVFEYILKKNGLDPAKDMNIDQSIDFGSRQLPFPAVWEILQWSFENYCDNNI